MATPPTKITVTNVDSSSDVILIPDGMTYSQVVQNWHKGGGYWGGSDFLTWRPYPQIVKAIVS
jgi:hypothetical protein